ncbi:hypothetical protein L3X38_016535 [Prunus dulcis]|uniref:Retrotransposon gag domain-containing protein n=1 Tax=Prunus dulcis TaxID=3755 RepID=A0AAD4Z978_PRUDU|nr:hypothetical protein L3X38_016535 [Prunus dulcis]
MQEFLQLEQGIMTVLEFEKKFNDLSKYCLPLVEDEIKKCQLFTMGLKASIRDIVISQRLTNFGDVVISSSLIESSQMMVRPRGELRRQQFDIGGPSQGSSKRGSYSSGSSSGRNYGGYQPGFSSSGGSNQSSSSVNLSGGRAARGIGRQLLSGSGRRSRSQCAKCGRHHSGPCQPGLLDVITVDSLDIFERIARCSFRIERPQLHRLRGQVCRVDHRRYHSLWRLHLVVEPRPL